jgi:transposase
LSIKLNPSKWELCEETPLHVDFADSLGEPFGDSLQGDWAPGTAAAVPGASGWDRVPPWERAPRESLVHPLLGSCPEQMMGSKSRMQGKDRSEQETKTKSTVGIDVCKAWLDIHILPSEEAFRVPNTKAGSKEIIRRLRHHDVQLIAIEATGKWHRDLHRNLVDHGYAVRIVNPLRARLFAEAMGLLAKTDRLDARMLAIFAGSLIEARPPAPEMIEALKELVQARGSAVEEQTSLTNQLKSAATVFLCRQLKLRLTQIAKHIKALETESLKRIRADPGLARRYDIVVSIPGFGHIVAITLLAWLSELGSCNDKQIATLCGLAPWPDDSSNRVGARHIRGGRQLIRNILYLAALTAKRFNQPMKAFFQRLTANGKATKQALVAVARKLIVLANTLVRADRLWQTEAPKCA